MYSALEIADYSIWYANHKRQILGNLKLQQVLYFLQAEFLVSTGKPLFEDRIEAWSWGAVVPAVYVEYRGYGAAHIPYYPLNTETYPNKEIVISDADKKRINNLLDSALSYEALQLQKFVMHQDPWKTVYIDFPAWYRESKLHKPEVISTESIKEFFSK